MKKAKTVLVLSVFLALAGCQDLSVENENNPDRELALSTPEDVQVLVSDTFTNFWSAQQWCDMGMLFTTMADENSSSWGNWGMRDMSSEPRVEWNNSPSYNYALSNESIWYRSYSGISNANDGLQALNRAEATESVDDNAFTRAGIDTARLRAFAKLMQGLNHATLAMVHDQAFVVDESIDLEAVASGAVQLDLVPYDQVLAGAIAMIDEAIAIAQASDFEITAEEDWVFGITFTDELLIQFANSMKARYLASVGRSPSERAAADWNAISQLIDAGITEDFAPVGDDNGDIREWDCMKFYGQDGTTWSRADYRTIGPADESGGYQAWLNTPVQDRVVFDVFTADRRIVGDAVDPTIAGSYFTYLGDNGPFPAARGTYHYSSHTHIRYVYYYDGNANGPMPYMIMSEMDLLKAEALLRTGGSLDTVAELLNATRVTNGQLNPAAGTDAAGAPEDEQSHLDTASLWAKLKHEKRLETFQTAAGLAYFDDRGWGDLVTGTPVQFPIPGAELDVLELAIYTFGGVGGSGAAPKNGRPTWLDDQPARNVTPR